MKRCALCNNGLPAVRVRPNVPECVFVALDKAHFHVCHSCVATGNIGILVAKGDVPLSLDEHLRGTDLGTLQDFWSVRDEGAPICPDWNAEALSALPFDPFDTGAGRGRS